VFLQPFLERGRTLGKKKKERNMEKMFWDLPAAQSGELASQLTGDQPGSRWSFSSKKSHLVRFQTLSFRQQETELGRAPPPHPHPRLPLPQAPGQAKASGHL
jgi:hypothetical protein